MIRQVIRTVINDGNTKRDFIPATSTSNSISNDITIFHFSQMLVFLEVISSGQEEGNKEKNLEAFSVLWCDAKVNLTEENRQTHVELRKSINYLKKFEAIEECKMYIHEHSEEKIVLIVSGNFGRRLVPEIHNLGNVVAIYIYCRNKEAHKQWSSAYNKVSYNE